MRAGLVTVKPGGTVASGSLTDDDVQPVVVRRDHDLADGERRRRHDTRDLVDLRFGRAPVDELAVLARDLDVSVRPEDLLA